MTYPLLPTRDGQAEVLTITTGGGEVSQDLGHWYSPARVNEMVREAIESQAAANTSSLRWLWGHCKAIGMTKQSDAGTIHHDIALYTSDLKTALRELVECKALADKFDEIKQDEPDVATAILMESLQKEYQRRTPKAWEDARRILGMPANGE